MGAALIRGYVVPSFSLKNRADKTSAQYDLKSYEERSNSSPLQAPKAWHPQLIAEIARF
jgi:hypothetical protein